MNILVLDKGYVNLRDHMGSDVTPVDMARASFAKRAETMNPAAHRLHRYLLASDPPHTMPFRHGFLTVEIKAPLMAARQLWRYIVGHDHRDPFFAWSEASRRYITLDTEFYVPGHWRARPDNAKQGSGEDLDPIISGGLTYDLLDYQKEGVRLFNKALEKGACVEQARGFLPSDFQYVIWCWSGSLQGFLHVLDERLDAHAQWETRQYAEALKVILRSLWPDTVRRWVDAPRCESCNHRQMGQE